jgi:hypothetical protein
MGGQDIIGMIKNRFVETGNPAQIPLLRGDSSFKAEVSTDGIYVDNLGNQPFLPWSVFIEAVSVLKANGGRARRGNAYSKLGEKDLPLNSIEGHIAHIVYKNKIGDSVFRRITPIACILIWAKLCRHKPGELLLSGVSK